MNDQTPPSIHAPSPEATSENQTGFQMTSSMIESLRATKPWTQLLAILGFISVGFLVLSSFRLIIGAFFMPDHGSGLPFPLFFLALFYLLMGVIYFFPSYFLLKYATSIGRFLRGGGQLSMEQALAYQKSFWKFVGILGLVSIGFAILGIVAAIIIPIFTSGMH
jgi:hypothetical protein